MPTISATVTPKPKIAWPAMCATRSNERQKMYPSTQNALAQSQCRGWSTG